MAENKNMETWNRLKQPPPDRLKTIGAGRLKGKSDINPQWRYEAITEEFGMCGVGWYFTVDKKWLEPAPDGQMFAFADITLYLRTGTNDGGYAIWGMGIPANGGSMLIQKETKTDWNTKEKSEILYANDEAYKMAITDALGTAAKMIGVAADVYSGRWDGSKYKDVIEIDYNVAQGFVKSTPATPRITDRERAKVALEKIGVLFDEYADAKEVKAELRPKLKTALSKYVFGTVSATEISKLGFGVLERGLIRFKSIFDEKKNTPERILIGEITEPRTDDVPDLFEGK